MTAQQPRSLHSTHRVLLACERASVAAKSASEGSLRLPPRLGAGLACAPPYLASSASMKLLACCPLPRMAATNAWQTPRERDVSTTAQHDARLLVSAPCLSHRRLRRQLRRGCTRTTARSATVQHSLKEAQSLGTRAPCWSKRVERRRLLGHLLHPGLELFALGQLTCARGAVSSGSTRRACVHVVAHPWRCFAAAPP